MGRCGPDYLHVLAVHVINRQCSVGMSSIPTTALYPASTMPHARRLGVCGVRCLSGIAGCYQIGSGTTGRAVLGLSFKVQE